MRGRPTGRPPSVPASSLVEPLRALIAAHAGKRCPTGEAMARRLSANEHAVREALRLLQAADELQVYRTAWIGGLRRRMRVKVDGQWSNWTRLSKKRTRRLTLDPDRLLSGDRQHVARVLQAGRY